MKRLAQLLFLFATMTVCSNSDPSGPSDELAIPARDAVIGTPRGPLPVPPPWAPVPPEAGPPPAAGPSAQLTIVKTAVPADVTIGPGDPVVFDIRVTNTGPGTALDVHVTDNLPHLGSTWTISAVIGDAPFCTFIGSTSSLFCGSQPGTPEMPPIPAFDLAPGGFFSLRVSSPTDENDCGTVTNTASAGADNATTGVTDSASIVIICPPQ